jgi:hypothetical protein
VVVGSNLSVQYWNIHDGSNLIQVSPQLFSTSLAHVYSSYPKSIVAMYQDIIQVQSMQGGGGDGDGNSRKNSKPLKLLMLGTEFGHVCVYHEQQAEVEPIPSAFLRVHDRELESGSVADHQNAILEKLAKPVKQNKISLRTLTLQAHRAKEVAAEEELAGQTGDRSHASDDLHHEMDLKRQIKQLDHHDDESIETSDTSTVITAANQPKRNRKLFSAFSLYLAVI